MNFKPAGTFTLYLILPCIWLLAGLVPAQEGPTDPMARLQALQELHRNALAEYYRPYTQAESDEEAAAIVLDPEKHPSKLMLGEFQALAKNAKPSEASAGALVWILRNTANEPQATAAKQALQELVSDYPQSEQLEKAIFALRYAKWSLGEESVTNALRNFLKSSPHRRVQAAASFVLACVLTESPSQNRQEARQLFDRIAKDYADLQIHEDGPTFADRAKGFVFEMDNLQIGMVAPDFEAVDQDGRSFKLSDYRGKVVLLDFWGFW